MLNLINVNACQIDLLYTKFKIYTLNGDNYSRHLY